MASGPRPAAAQCSPIACGQTLAGALSVVGEVDCFEVSLTAGETVSITTQEIAGFFQACWELFSPLGGSLGITCGQDQRTVPDTGTYMLNVFDSGGNQSGAYDLNLVVVSDTGSSCGEPLGCGETLPRQIVAVAESDTFVFEGTVGDGVSACWHLYDPQGVLIANACGVRRPDRLRAGEDVSGDGGAGAAGLPGHGTVAAATFRP